MHHIIVAFGECDAYFDLIPLREIESITTRMGLEPMTSAVTGRRSNQLSHRAVLVVLQKIILKTL